MHLNASAFSVADFARPIQRHAVVRSQLHHRSDEWTAAAARGFGSCDHGRQEETAARADNDTLYGPRLRPARAGYRLRRRRRERANERHVNRACDSRYPVIKTP